MNWNDAKAWVDDFTYAGLDDWRLPGLPFEPIWGGELGHLYFESLGNPAYNPQFGPRGEAENVNFGPFVNSPFATPYRLGVFWMGSELAPPGSNQWIFAFDSQAATDHSDIFGQWFVWPVRDGDVAGVPDTGSTLMMLAIALLGLVAIRIPRTLL